MTPADVLDLTAKGFGVTLDAMRAKRPSRYAAKARDSAIDGLTQLGLASGEIGGLLDLDASTVRYHQRKARLRALA